MTRVYHLSINVATYSLTFVRPTTICECVTEPMSFSLRSWLYEKRTELRFRHGASSAGRSHGLNAPLIVNLTSYPKRFPGLDLTIKSLLSQTICPDRIILWVAQVDYEALPKAIKDLEGRIFSTEVVERDLRSFKKIIPALKAHPDSYLVTADDDIVYGKGWLQALVDASRGSAGSVVGHRAHEIRVNPDDSIMPYISWILDTTSSEPSERVFLTSGHGILFPPNSLHVEALNVQAFLRLCPRADDVWLYFMVRLNGLRYRRIAGRSRWGADRRGVPTGSLWDSNSRGGNDEAIDAMTKQYGRLYL